MEAGFQITNAETMLEAVRMMGIIPFFSSSIPGYSIRELTAPGCWFDDEDGVLGPWDWKIDCLQSGEIAYGKFLSGGKAAFATVEWYKELMNYRRAHFKADKDGRKILRYVEENGSIGSKEVRALLGVKKAAADAAIARLQHGCCLLTGDIHRVFRGPNLSYSGWQTSTYCTPEAFFSGGGGSGYAAFTAFVGFPLDEGIDPLATSHTPEESLETLVSHIESILPIPAPRSRILKLLG